MGELEKRADRLREIAAALQTVPAGDSRRGPIKAALMRERLRAGNGRLLPRQRTSEALNETGP